MQLVKCYVLIVLTSFLLSCATQRNEFSKGSGYFQGHKLEFRVHQIADNQIKLDVTANAAGITSISETDLHRIYTTRANELCRGLVSHMDLHVVRTPTSHHWQYTQTGPKRVVTPATLSIFGVITCPQTILVADEAHRDKPCQ